MAFFLSAHKLRKATRELTVRVFQPRKSCLVFNAASVLVSINITKPVHAYEAAAVQNGNCRARSELLCDEIATGYRSSTAGFLNL